MKPGIRFSKIWSDDDMIELRIDVSDGTSFFSNEVYVGYQKFEDTIKELKVFRDHIYGGLLDIEFGSFGPEYASGAFHARLHFQEPGKLYITCKLQSRFERFSIKEVASEATLYLESEPILLDNFITVFKYLNAIDSNSAILKATNQKPLDSPPME
jgi:hypothetical protein